MAITREQRGFALYVAVIFMSVMLTFGLTLASLGFKQQQLSAGAVGVQRAFYAADTALECALYADQQEGFFAYENRNDSPAQSIACGASSAEIGSGGGVNCRDDGSSCPDKWISSTRISIDSGRCADIRVSKTDPTLGSPKTQIFAQGYDISCAVLANPGNTRFSSRGISARY